MALNLSRSRFQHRSENNRLWPGSTRMARNTALGKSRTSPAQTLRSLSRRVLAPAVGPRNRCHRRRATCPMTQRINWSRDIYVTRCRASTCVAGRGLTASANPHARRRRRGVLPRPAHQRGIGGSKPAGGDTSQRPSLRRPTRRNPYDRQSRSPSSISTLVTATKRA